jgi:L-amino acid N-acyltransferase YncA
MVIRAATDDDWSAICRFMRPIAAAGETFSWDRDLEKAEARAMWCHKPPGRTIVAVDDDGIILGTAETEPNHGGPESHVATASFMVDPDNQGRGVGRTLCKHVLEAAQADGYRAMQFNAVAETNVAATTLWRSLGFEVLATVPRGIPSPGRGRRRTAHHVPPPLSLSK